MIRPIMVLPSAESSANFRENPRNVSFIGHSPIEPLYFIALQVVRSQDLNRGKAMLSRILLLAILFATTLCEATPQNIVNQDVPGMAGPVHVRVMSDCKGDFLTFILFPINTPLDTEHTQEVIQATKWAVQMATPICPQTTRMQVFADAGGKPSTASFSGVALASRGWELSGQFTRNFVYPEVVPPNLPIAPSSSVLGVPPQFQLAFSQASAGVPFQQNYANEAFISGISRAVIKLCQDKAQQSGTSTSFPTEVQAYGFSGAKLSEMAQYSGLGRSASTLANSAANFLAGAQVGNRLGCSATGLNFVKNLNSSVIASMHDGKGGPARFIRTCHGHFASDEECLCFAKAARAYEPNIFQERYDAYYVKEIGKKSDLISMFQYLGCQVPQ